MLKIRVVFLIIALSLFSQAFEYQGFSNWTIFQSNLKQTTEKLVLSKNDYAYAQLGEKNWQDYELKLKLKPLSYGKNGVLRLFFRQEYPWNSYSLDITATKIELTRYDGIWDKCKVLAHSKGIKAGVEAELILKVEEEKFTVYLDQELFISASSIKYKNGMITLFAENAAFQASDFSIVGTISSEIKSDPGYFPKGDTRGGGVEHMVLIYGNSGSKWTQIDAYPYVGYLTPLEDANYQIIYEDYLFDSFLFLALKAPDGYAFDSPSRGKPATKKEWQWYIDSLFTENEQLNAFDKAFELINQQLGQNKKAKIYIMIPSPMPETQKFGAVDKEGNLSFNHSDPTKNKNQRFKAVKWYVDQVLERFEKLEPQNLELVGFYWLDESINKQVSGGKELLLEISDYLHQKDLKFSWIPYFSVAEHRNYKDYGFDLCIYQPNYMFNSDLPLSRLVNTAKEAYQYNLGVEIEASDSILGSMTSRERFYDYLRAGRSFNFMTDATLAYYQGKNVFGAAALSSFPEIREIYDNLYKFIKEEFEEPLEKRR